MRAAGLGEFSGGLLDAVARQYPASYSSGRWLALVEFGRPGVHLVRCRRTQRYQVAGHLVVGCHVSVAGWSGYAKPVANSSPDSPAELSKPSIWSALKRARVEF